jgi:hypothetical protein
MPSHQNGSFNSSTKMVMTPPAMFYIPIQPANLSILRSPCSDETMVHVSVSPADEAEGLPSLNRWSPTRS